MLKLLKNLMGMKKDSFVLLRASIYRSAYTFTYLESPRISYPITSSYCVVNCNITMKFFKYVCLKLGPTISNLNHYVSHKRVMVGWKSNVKSKKVWTIKIIKVFNRMVLIMVKYMRLLVLVRYLKKCKNWIWKERIFVQQRLFIFPVRKIKSLEKSGHHSGATKMNDRFELLI